MKTLELPNNAKLFPIEPGTKEPACKWKTAATADTAQIKEWISKGYDLGATPAAGYMVLDVDVKGVNGFEWLQQNAPDLPTTWSAETPSGGKHYWFKLPTGMYAPNKQDAKTGLDIRGEAFADSKGGGYVKVFGTDGKGNSYVQHPAGVMAEAPQWLLDYAGARFHGTKSGRTPVMESMDTLKSFYDESKAVCDELAMTGEVGWDDAASQFAWFTAHMMCHGLDVSSAYYEHPLVQGLDEESSGRGSDKLEAKLAILKPRYEELQNTAEGKRSTELNRAIAQLELKREAERLVLEAEAAAQWVPPMGFISSARMAELVKEKTKWCIAGISKEVSRIGIIAKRKAGKTTLALDLAKSYTQGTPFLGKYEVHNRIEGNVAFLSYDMELADLQQWTEKVGLQERFGAYDLRGQANPFASAIGREWLEEELKRNNVQAVIIDSYGDAFPGQDGNNNTEVNNWLLEVYAMFQRAGVQQTVFIAHAGKAGSTARGASTFEDKQDTLITLDVNDSEDRFIEIKGRNVGLERTPLVFDEEQHRLSLVNVAYDEEKWLRSTLNTFPNAKRSELDDLWKEAFGTAKGRLTALIARLEKDGKLIVSTHKANRKSYKFTA